MADLTAQQKAEARQAFAENKACPECGGLHQRACNRVKRQAWIGQGSAAGTRTEVEYWPEWKQPGVIWPEDAFGTDPPEAPGGR